MDDIEIRFERENLEGIVPVGTYLIDAAKRLGVRLPDGCDAESNEHSCEITVTAGGDLLSPMTSAEATYFSAGAGTPNRRLADQARIDKPGEIVIMTAEKKAQKAAEEE